MYTHVVYIPAVHLHFLDLWFKSQIFPTGKHVQCNWNLVIATCLVVEIIFWTVGTLVIQVISLVHTVQDIVISLYMYRYYPKLRKTTLLPAVINTLYIMSCSLEGLIAALLQKT